MAEPITVDEARAYLHVDGDDDEQDITDAIVDARGWVEDYTGLLLTRRSHVEQVPSFSSSLRAWPIASIDGVSYLDVDGATEVVDAESYLGLIVSRPATLRPVSGYYWPRTLCGSTIAVTMTAGFDGADEINAFSPNLMRAMRLLIGGFYRDRETGGLAGEVDTAARRLCRNLRRWAL